MFDGLILGSVEAGVSDGQRAGPDSAVCRPARRRPLVPGGRESLADGGYARSIYLNDLLPVTFA